MASEAGQQREFLLQVTLLEDLHTGTGGGDAICDLLHARDADGYPVIPRTHLKGVWRDNALRLAHLGLVQMDAIERLFGRGRHDTAAGARDSGPQRPDSTRGGRGLLVCPTLTATAVRGRLPTWDATARKGNGNRAPDDHSLRRREYLPAGTELSGRVRLQSDDPALIESFQTIVRFTDRLGGERTRGSGQVRVRLKPAGPGNAATGQGRKRHRGISVKKGCTQLRLLLRTLAPVCIPTTGHPGNVIGSETRIPGRTLLGSLADAIIAAGARSDPLFERRISVGSAYPLPSATGDSLQPNTLADWLVLPMPLNLHHEKPGTRPQELWPHWADADKAPVFHDVLLGSDDQQGPDEAEGPKLKRPSADAYLIRTGQGHWRWFEQPLETSMRNRRGHPLEPVKESEQDLFSVESIPEGTLLLCDIQASSYEDLKALAGPLGAVLGHPVLRVGRGGAPVEIAHHAVMQRPRPRGKSRNKGPLTLLLTSDLIARDPETLGFEQTLSTRLVARLARVRQPLEEPDDTRVFGESCRLVGFNAASGLPRAPAIAIRRGSIIRIPTPAAVPIRKALLALDAHQSLGERTWEGLGRFMLDPDLGPPIPEPSGADARGATDDSPLATRERAIAGAEDFCGRVDGDREKPVRIPASQLGNLRATLASIPGMTIDRKDLTKRLDAFLASALRRRGRARWQTLESMGVVTALLDAACEGDTCSLEGAETFLRFLSLELGAGDDDEQ